MIMLRIEKLTGQLSEHFYLNDLEMDNPLVLAAALDPSFQKLSFLFSEDQRRCMYVRSLLSLRKPVIAAVKHLDVSSINNKLSVLDCLLD